MFKKLRKEKNRKKAWIILAILVLPAFVLWGSGSLIRSKQESAYAGKIFGNNISLLEYKDAMDATRNQAIIQFGDKFSEIQKSLNLESQAWERLILLTEAKRRKVKVSDKEIVELIESYPFLQRKGRFNNAMYSEMLQYVFHTQARIFEEQTRQNLMLAKLYKEVTSSIDVTEQEIKEEYRKYNEQISIYYLASLPSDFTKDIAPSEEGIKDYFAKNSLQFKQPLSFNIEYITLADEGKDENAVKDKIKSLLHKKESFSKLANEAGFTVKETGLFGQTEPIPGIGWSPEILILLSKIKAGEFLPLIHMDKYYYLIKLKEKKDPYIPDFQTIKDKVKEAFIKNKSKEIAKEKIESCLKAVNFEQAAKISGLKSGSTDLFKYASYIEGIGTSDNFWLAATKLKEDNFSGVIEMPSGFYIIKLKSRIPIDEKKFTQEKTEFSQKLLLQKRQEYFLQFVEELKEKAQRY
jgi:hypothetical protein